MGTFTIQIEIADPNRDRWTTLDALVDTGASITFAPASILQDLGVEPAAQQLFQFAQGETRQIDIGYARLRFEGKEIITPVLFNDEGSPPLLGAMALENAFMDVDPVANRLIPVPGLMMKNGGSELE